MENIVKVIIIFVIQIFFSIKKVNSLVIRLNRGVTLSKKCNAFDGKKIFLQNLNMMVESKFSVDVTILGGGPAGMSLAWQLQEQKGVRVALVDPRGLTPASWYPNYGEWREEWHALADRLNLPELKKCTTTEWEVTDCFFGGEEEKLRLPRPYVRVDRVKMQALLRERYLSANGIIVASKLSTGLVTKNIFDENLVHNSAGTQLRLDDGTSINTKVVIDATGLESQLVLKEDPYLVRQVNKELNTGYQIAYGFIAKVSSLGSYDFSAMTLFDYRTEFVSKNETWLSDAEERPTFMYVMPLSQNSDGTYRVFWEETSLCGRGERRLSFEECKRRAMKRLSHYDIQVLDIEEEEYCYIPMGGELPDRTQRIIAFGGAANLVHPSTGYHVCRMLAASTDVATAVADGVKASLAPDQIAANAYNAMWSLQNRGQRDFQAYGGDFLMMQRVQLLRGFFSAFFSVEQSVWAGFLAGWPGLPGNHHHETWHGRLGFALQLFAKMPNDVRVAMVLYAIRYTIEYGPNTLLRSLMPAILFGRGAPEVNWKPPQKILGDVDAKEEARRMMKEFKALKSSDKEENNVVIPSPFN